MQAPRIKIIAVESGWQGQPKRVEYSISLDGDRVYSEDEVIAALCAFERDRSVATST